MPVRVLIVDDSHTARTLLIHMINASADMEVIGEAVNGSEAIELTHRLQPDVILMDITMPRMNGLEATEEIMNTRPTPIVLISAGLEGKETEIAFQAMRLGALTVLAKPVGINDPDHTRQVAALVSTVHAMAGVQVIHHRQPRPLTRPKRHTTRPFVKGAPQLVGIVSSTGGPAALSEIIRRLPADFATPVVIVQHIAPDFLVSLTSWLDGLTPLKVSIARAGEWPLRGHIYLAPGGVHTEIKTQGFVTRNEPTTSHMPNGDILLESIARHCGAQAIGVVLTGMGADGAKGLLAMSQAGAFTIAQDQATSAVYGMPKEAAALGAARRVLPLQEIAGMLAQLATGQEVN